MGVAKINLGAIIHSIKFDLLYCETIPGWTAK